MLPRRALTLCTLGGAFPFIVDVKSSKLVVSSAWLAYSVTAVVVRMCCGAFKIVEARKNGARGFDFCLTVGHQITFAVVGTVSLWYIVSNREYINKFHLAMDNVDRVLLGLKIPAKENVDPGCILLAFSAVLICVLKFSVRKMSFLKASDIIEAVTAISTLLIVIGTMVAFTSFVRQILGELQVLNDQLRRTFLQHCPGTFKANGRGLEALTDAHYYLTMAGMRLNSAYRETYFAVISGSVWGVTSRAYSAVYWFSAKQELGESLLQFTWMMFWLVVIFSAVLPCSSAQAHSIKFNRDLALLMIRDTYSYSTHEKNKLQLHVGFDFTLQFDCGVFQMNRGLIHSILGQVTVFAVMLTQISMQEKPSEAVNYTILNNATVIS